MRKSDINPMPEYFDRYINLVSDSDLPQAFDESIEQLTALDQNRLENLSGATYEKGKFTVKEILQHVIDWERILSFRALLFARKEGSIPPGIDQDLLAVNMNAEARSIKDLVEELKVVRISTKALFESFDAATLLNTGTNWKYEISVLALGFAIVGHQIHHLKIIEDKYFPLV